MNAQTKLILASALLLGSGAAFAADPQPTGTAVQTNAETGGVRYGDGAGAGGARPTGRAGPQQRKITNPAASQAPGAPGNPAAAPSAGGVRNPGAGVMINKDIIPTPRPETMRSVGNDSQFGTTPQQRKIPNPTASQAPGVPASPAASRAGPRNPGAGVMINKDIIPTPRPDTIPSTDGGSQQPRRPLPGAGPRPQP